MSLRDLRRYRGRWLRGDAIAGLTVTAYAVPQVMAYSTLAGLPPQTGLWVAVITMAIYAVIGTSRLLSVGPESTTALLTAAALAPLALGDPSRYASLAATLALLCGAFAIIAWLLRLGFIADLISRPVLVGYMTGVGIIMIASQLGKLTGVDTAGDSFLQVVSSFIDGVRENGISVPSLAVGGSVAVALIVLTPRFPRIPLPLIAVIGSALVVGIFHLGVRMVSSPDGRFPGIALPSASSEDLRLMLLPAIGIFIVGYADNILTARMLAEPGAERPNKNRELLALGTANLGASVVHGFPISSSASRATLAKASGARTQMYSLIAAASVLVVLLAFDRQLSLLPIAALAGLIVFAATRLIDFGEFARLWSFRKREFVLALSATVGVLLFDILYGVLAAVVLSILELLTRVARPHAAVLGQPAGIAGWHDIDDYPEARQIPGLTVFRYDSPLFFANADDFAGRCEEVIEQTSPEWFLLNMEGNDDADITALDALERVRQFCVMRGTRMALVRVKHELLEQLRRVGLVERIGADMVFPTLPTAVEAFDSRKQD